MKKAYSAPQMTVARFDVAEHLTQSGEKNIKCQTSVCYWYNANEQ